MATYTFHVRGMHCASCVMMIENGLRDLSSVTAAEASMRTHSVEVVGEFGGASAEAVAERLTEAVKAHGYALSVERHAADPQWHEFGIAVPIAVAMIGAFAMLQRAGIVGWLDAREVSYGTVFLIGMIASLSTCMAVVGGVVLSLSAAFARQGERVRPQLAFHASRIISFFVLGGAMGAAGAAFRLGAETASVLGIAVGAVMFVIGVNLLDVFHGAKKLQLTMPKLMSRGIFSMAKRNHVMMPAAVGVLTFFLPCGFTQSMQLYALGTGSFSSGALVMLSFALGTLPVLVLISFGTAGVRKRGDSGVFLKVAGLMVIAFAIFNIVNGLAALGVMRPIFSI